MLNRLKIGTRTSAVFGALALALAIIAAGAAWELGTLRSNLEAVPELLDVRAATAEWQGHTAVNAARTLAVLQAEDPTLSDRLAAAMKETSARITVIQKRIEDLPLSQADRERFAAVGTFRKAYITARDETLALKKAGNSEAAASLERKFRPALKDYETAIAAFIQGYADGQISSHKEDMAESVHVLSLLAGAGLAFMLGAAVLCLLLVRSIVRPLHEATVIANCIADGDLSIDIEAKTRDEVGELLRAMKAMASNLSALVAQVRDGAETTATAVSQIAAGNSDLSQRTEEQASSLEETASSMEELTSTVKQNAENARQANQLAAGASSMAIKGGEVVGQVVASMSAINDSSKKIADIIGVIDGIAFQTNILALNAAVEAARAGEQGRGFAVVASEVRMLAQRSAGAAKEIKALITDSASKIEDGSKLVDQTGQTMEEIVTSVKRVTDIMAEIAAASQEQTSGIEQVNQAITQMDQVTQQNAALVEEAAAAAESMKEQAHSLTSAVAIFRLSSTEAASGVPQHKETSLAAPEARAAAPGQWDRQSERRGPNRARNVTRMPNRSSEISRTLHEERSEGLWS